MKKVQQMLEALEKEFRNKKQYSAADKLLPIIEEAEKDGWIPCSEMLPSIDMTYPNAKDYLVYYEHDYYDIASYSNINRFWHGHTTEPYWNCAQYCKVVAWRELPEPYKGE